MIDAFRSTIWEGLDDYVYYIKATGNTIDFMFGIFLFLNGAWILIFESGGTIRAIMICMHAYFNIWCQAKLGNYYFYLLEHTLLPVSNFDYVSSFKCKGWETFMRRRLAVRRINSLAEATPEQLASFDDVCSICYHEMNSARITRCNHYFHELCIRKWLYLQDCCPLCHNTFYCTVKEEEENLEERPHQD